jgi:hypothetical protein
MRSEAAQNFFDGSHIMIDTRRFVLNIAKLPLIPTVLYHRQNTLPSHDIFMTSI